jgi:hypothetical protein
VDFPAGANLENGNAKIRLQSITRFFRFLPGRERQTFLERVVTQPSEQDQPEKAPSKTPPDEGERPRQHMLRETIRDVKTVPALRI